ncbi:GntR family transcriptional regulator [Erysipelothrix urinaevulpis]|uniref:GntR family transcriptional regulator n=1 Tax=Erysipelothrix urinaevulpis TaxID=2683717 RepID=UPI00135CE7D8|nr:GntR family transcriptional regulator [Erysipelothrix urinaevulpis]
MSHKYTVIARDIESKILNNTYASGSKLPTEESLMKEFEVSRNTIRKAVDLLARKGFIMPVQGSGLFVRNNTTSDAVSLENFHGLTADNQHKHIETIILEFSEIQADQDIASKLNCELGQALYYVNRLRIVDGEKWVVEYSYFNKKHVPYLNKEILSESIYDYIQKALKQQVGYVDRIIEAAPLDEKNAKLLGLKVGDPCLVSTNKSMFKSGEIFDYSIDVHHYKHTKFSHLANLMY